MSSIIPAAKSYSIVKTKTKYLKAISLRSGDKAKISIPTNSFQYNTGTTSEYN